MKTAALPPQQRLRELLNYDPATGIFTWVVSPSNSVRVGSEAGGKSRSRSVTYRLIKIDGRPYAAHRLAWVYLNGDGCPDSLDHIDGDGLNNRINNIRPCTLSQNSANQKIHSNNTSGYKGVVWDKRRQHWIAAITFLGKMMYLGRFSSPIDAHLAYARKAHQLFGDFARP